MKAIIDTNIIIDILEHRKPFFRDSYKVIQMSMDGKLEIFMSAGAVTDIFYIVKRNIRDSIKAKEKIISLTTLINICDTTSNDINYALTLNINDFEDAVLSATAKREKANYIITRNCKDFSNSPVPAISPAQFLGKFKEGSD